MQRVHAFLDTATQERVCEGVRVTWLIHSCVRHESCHACTTHVTCVPLMSHVYISSEPATQERVYKNVRQT